VASVLGGGAGPESIVGFFTATPLAIVGILVVKREQRWIAAAALVPIPLVLASKASEEAASSWGVRYLIPSALLLVVMAVTARPNILTTCVPVVVLAALVSLMGIAFEIDRSHGVADLAERISERPEDVVVARPRLLLQEAGAFWDDQQWLWAADARAEREAASIAVERDAQSLVVLVHQSDGRAPEVAPYCLSSEEAVPYASGGDLTAYVYQLPAGQAGCDRGVT